MGFKDIYIGMMQFMVLQVIGLILIVIFPQIALWLPTYYMAIKYLKKSPKTSSTDDTKNY
jgi:hypothetical protein